MICVLMIFRAILIVMLILSLSSCMFPILLIAFCYHYEAYYCYCIFGASDADTAYLMHLMLMEHYCSSSSAYLEQYSISSMLMPLNLCYWEC